MANYLRELADILSMVDQPGHLVLCFIGEGGAAHTELTNGRITRSQFLEVCSVHPRFVIT